MFLVTSGPCSLMHYNGFVCICICVMHTSISSLHGLVIWFSNWVIIFILCFLTRLLFAILKCQLGFTIFSSFHCRTLLTIIRCTSIVRMCSYFQGWFCSLNDWHWVYMSIMTCFYMGVVFILSWLLLKMSLVSSSVSVFWLFW